MSRGCACKDLPPALCIIQQMTPCRERRGTHIEALFAGVRVRAERCLVGKCNWYYGNIVCIRCGRELPIYRESQS